MHCIDKDGKFITSKKYKAILSLYALVKGKGFVELMRSWDGWQVNIYAKNGKRIGDAAQNFGTSGAKQDLIEVYGFNLNDPVGNLTVEEAYKYFEPHLKGVK